jgi:hypothetical protein
LVVLYEAYHLAGSLEHKARQDNFPLGTPVACETLRKLLLDDEMCDTYPANPDATISGNDL